jgi:hypothetical protein
MSIKLATAIQTARTEVIRAACDAGAGAGQINFYSTPIPATRGEAITTQTLLASCVLHDSVGTVTNGVLTFLAINDDVAVDASGAIAFGRIVDSDGTFVLDGDAGVTGSGALFIFNNVSVVAGGIVRILSMSLADGD